MKRSVLLTLMVLMAVPGLTAQHMLDYSDIAAGKFTAKTVRGVRSMNDGEHYTTLSAGKIEKFSYKTGELVSTIFDGTDCNFEDPVVAYAFSPDEKLILLSTRVEYIYRHSFKAQYWIYDTANRQVNMLTHFDKVQEASFSPDGKYVFYIYENDIYYVDLATSNEYRITNDGLRNHIINGHTDWVYEEEFAFTKAFDVSPDGRYLAYLRFDESRVREYDMQIFGEGLYPGTFTYKYPKAGEDNSIVTLHVYDLVSKSSITVDTGSNTNIYIPRIGWTPEASLWFYRSNRLQNHFELLLADNIESGFAQPTQGRDDTFTGVRVIYEEKNPRYIERLDDETVTFLPGGRFIVKNETNGYAHLYMHKIGVGVTDTLTRGKWDVTQLAGVTKDRVYYISTEDSPLRRNLYSVRLNGKGKTRLTEDNGYYSILPGTDFKYFISYFSNTTTPNLVRLHNSSGKVLRILEDNTELRDRARKMNIPRKEFFRFTTMQGTSLNGYIVKPNGFDESKEYPVLLTQYSGPGSQQVLDRWWIDWTDVLVQEGYIVVCVDGRGTGGRGADFRKCTYGNLGGFETEDQIETAKYLATLPYIDKDRIGIYGWSYGGFMALNCILKGADIFKTAVAVAPVTSWRFYDTIYTEIYNGLPQDNPRGYDENSPINFADRLKGNLLIIHGTADDNVHVQNTYAMASALVKAGKQFDMMIYTDDNHGMMPGGRRNVYEKMLDYVLKNL